MALTVVIADADALARHLIRIVLERAGVTVLAEARCAEQAIDLVLQHRPDVALLDGGDAVHAIHRRAPGQPMVVLAREEDPHAALAALRSGASGYLSKELDLDALPRTLAGVAAGEAAISRRMTRYLIEAVSRRPALRPIKGPLTAREWEVVDLLAPDRTTDDIADRLVLSPETVRTHVKSIMRKLDVHSRHDAPAAAARLRTA
jgi:DNA-binding NarL/FixJ family response regulator